MWVCVYVCVCVSVFVKQRERETETDASNKELVWRSSGLKTKHMKIWTKRRKPHKLTDRNVLTIIIICLVSFLIYFIVC